MTLTVVKVGGSFAHYFRLAALAQALAAGAGKTVIVPGGGPFANLVRSEQRRIGYDDATAHRMALLAMAEFGYVLAGFSPTLVPAADLAAIHAVLAEGRVPVWLPLSLIAGDPEIPESWDVTSDSLAAWLCGRLEATRLIFLKLGAMPPGPTLSGLVAEGVLDPQTPAFLAKAGAEAWLCGPCNLPALARALADGSAVGRPIR